MSVRAGENLTLRDAIRAWFICLYILHSTGFQSPSVIDHNLRKLSEKRVFPAIDIPKSGTRREDLLLDKDEQEAVYIMRRALNGMKSEEAVENILNMFVHTKDNRELVQRVKRQKFI